MKTSGDHTRVRKKALFKGKNILLGVTGGIAAYKITYLIRLLVQDGADVKVIMTPAARDFVTPLSLATLSRNEVITSFVKGEEQGYAWNNHVDLGRWADVMIVAPATANTLSKMAHGTADNFLLATYLSTECPVYVAPAMDLDMYQHPSTLENLEKLKSHGVEVIPAESGELASGLHGAGRLPEPEAIFDFVETSQRRSLPLYGRKIMITAGPTHEPIDPVRYIGNRSSGKMGYELADAARRMGAEVTLISGPTSLKNPHPDIHLIRVESANEMLKASLEAYPSVDVVIAAAAVADYRPKTQATQKIKKTQASLVIELEPNPDILATLGQKKAHQKLVGFALETENELENAQGKLQRKNLDFIVLNSLNDKGAGFQGETNKVSLVFTDGRVVESELKAKSEVARDILMEVKNLFDA